MRAFLKKEWLEFTRTGRLWILLLIFVLFGIMNPAMAKITPWMMQVMSDSLAEAGFILTDMKIDAMTSWTQFYKNIPIGLIIFVLFCSGSFTSEYQKGTLIPVITKGMPRHTILAAKTTMMMGLWTILYMLCFGITYGYNAYFWDNSIAEHVFGGAACYWLFGMWILALLVFFSILSRTNTQVLLGTGAMAFGIYLTGMFPKLSKYLPSRLMEGITLLQGTTNPNDFMAAAVVTLLMVILAIGMSVYFFDRKQI